jgi:phage host-nuclease inhibitor protein Gam
METNKAVVVYSNKGAPVWVIPEDQTQWDPAKGDIQTLPTVVVSAPRLDDLQQTDPLAWLYTTQSLPEEVAKKTVGDYLYNFAKGTIDLANQTGNSTIINSAANALKAGGGILEAFNGLVTLVGKNPQDTSVGKFAKSLMDLGKASNTEEYKAALANMQSTWADAKGITGTAKAIWKNFTDYPTEFLAEIVGVEGMQEVVPLLIGGGAATAARGLALAKGMGTTLASQIGTRAGLTAAAASDIAESAGGAAANAFEDAYQTAIKTGKSESEATKIALDVAGRTALIAGTTTAVTLGIGGQALEKVILGNKGTGQLANVFDEIGNRIKTGGSIVVKEGVTEGIEEGLQQGYLEGQLYQLDPTRDVAKNIATSTILGAIAGGGVAGGAYAGYSTGDVVSNLLSSNPTISQTIGSATSAQDLSNKLSSLGIDDNIIKTNLLNTKYDTDYTSSLEAEKAFFNRPDFVASQQDIDALVGATPNSGLPAALEAYVDPRVVDRQEIIDAARAEGLTLTEEQIQKYIGQKDEASTLTGAKTEFDPLGTTQEEAAAIFKDVYGYTPSATELNQFVKDNFSEQQARTDIGAYVDPRQVTRQEVLDFFKSTGYTPTEQEITQYIKQGTDVNQDAIRELLNQYVDPRYVDYNEAADALKAAGITKPSPDDVYKLIGQYQETEAAGKVAADLDRLRFNSLQYQIGQISGAGLSEQFASFEERVAAEIARAEAAGLTRDQAINVALDRVAGDLNYTREQLINQLGTTEAAIRQDLQSGMLNLGTEIKSVAQRLQEQIAANEASGMSRDEALNAAINKVSGDLGTTKENLLTQLGTTEANLRQEFSTGISNIQKDFQTRVAELQAQGLSQFEATQQALNEVRLTQSQQFAMTQDQIKQVADFVGKPYRDVTQADIDFVNTIIGQQQAQPGTALTQQQLAYDANLDGRIDQADLNLLQGAISGTVDQPFVPGAGTIWTQQPTGVYGVLASQQAAAVERDRLQREQAAKLAQQGRQQANVNALQQMLMTAPDIAGQQVTVKAPDPAQIGYIYDWNSIFATPQQERMFITPYAQGGMVGSDDDVTAELMKILRS